MRADSFSIRSHSGAKSTVEKTAQVIFTVCGFFAILAVVSITLYMIISGAPALFQVGIKELIFSTVWQPEADVPSFGILYIILTLPKSTVSIIHSYGLTVIFPCEL